MTILIQPRILSVLEIPDESSCGNIAKAISCKWVERIKSPKGFLWVDEEGKLDYPNPLGYFQVSWYNNILAGNALYIGKLSLQEVKERTTFLQNPAKELVSPEIFVFYM